jgi:hypothetical protein
LQAGNESRQIPASAKETGIGRATPARLNPDSSGYRTFDECFTRLECVLIWD